MFPFRYRDEPPYIYPEEEEEESSSRNALYIAIGAAAGFVALGLSVECTAQTGIEKAGMQRVIGTGAVTGFVENMVAGRGFIAIACVVFGRWNPLGVLLACLFFGLTDAAQVRLQSLNPDIPYQFFVMAPYALAVVFLIFFAGRAGLPRALGVPFLSGRG